MSRVRRAIVAVALGLLLLTGVGVTQAGWHQSAQVDLDTFRAGSVDLTSSAPSYRLHSRQPAGSRTYSSAQVCTPAEGFTECRVITNTMNAERLVAGDRLVMASNFNLTLTGNNLAGQLAITANGFSSSNWASIGGGAPQIAVTGPSGSTVGPSANSVSVPVRAGGSNGAGSYQVTATVNTQPANGSNRWDTTGQGLTVPVGTLSGTFTQGVPQ